MTPLKRCQSQTLLLKKTIDFGVKPFKKGLVGVERAKPSACRLCRRGNVFTASKTFRFLLSPLGDPKYCSKKAVPADVFDISRYSFSFFDYFLGSAARNNRKRNVSEAVKKRENRQRVQAKDSVLLKPAIL